MGSAVLLHAERAVALFAVFLAVLMVLAHAADGRLPTQLGTAGLGYETPEGRSAEAVDELQREVDQLERVVAALAAALVDGGRRGD